MAKQERLSNDEFLARLSKYLNTNSANLSGSIHLTQKRLSHPSSTGTEQPTSQPTSTKSPFPDINPPHPLPLLLRATNGKSAASPNKQSKSGSKAAGATKGRSEEDKKWKIATVVEPDEIDAFFVRYGDVWRKEMSALKKRDRKKRKKDKKGGAGASAAGS